MTPSETILQHRDDDSAGTARARWVAAKREALATARRGLHRRRAREHSRDRPRTGRIFDVPSSS
jgi:hypothetical protein